MFYNTFEHSTNAPTHGADAQMSIAITFIHLDGMQDAL